MCIEKELRRLLVIGLVHGLSTAYQGLISTAGEYFLGFSHTHWLLADLLIIWEVLALVPERVRTELAALERRFLRLLLFLKLFQDREFLLVVRFEGLGSARLAEGNH